MAAGPFRQERGMINRGTTADYIRDLRGRKGLGRNRGPNGGDSGGAVGGVGFDVIQHSDGVFRITHGLLSRSGIMKLAGRRCLVVGRVSQPAQGVQVSAQLLQFSMRSAREG